MTSTGRIPCINPRCRRTAPAAKFDGQEIICGKCFRSLPAELRARYRKLGRDDRRMLRLVSRRVAEHSIAPDVVDRLQANMVRRGVALWSEIKSRFTEPVTPAGLENFLHEVGLV
jgi:hypothetical protein